jgi:DNA-binding NtrC family response regulator
MPIEMQVPLLRFLESRRYFKVGGRREIAADVRVIAATSRTRRMRSATASCARTLLPVAVFPLELPPLRDRDEDAVALAEHFLALLNTASGTRKRLSENSRDLARHFAGLATCASCATP